jgi:hypothetical protein
MEAIISIKLGNELVEFTLSWRSSSVSLSDKMGYRVIDGFIESDKFYVSSIHESISYFDTQLLYKIRKELKRQHCIKK